MKGACRFGVTFPMAGLLLVAAFVVVRPPALADQSTVDDETGLMSSTAIAQIDARNQRLYGATGRVVVVVVVRGADGATASGAGITAADTIAKGYYGAVIFVATGAGNADIVYTGKTLKWIPYDEQVSLRQTLTNSIQYCCPSDTLPATVDQLASAMEAGEKVAPSPSNYVRDRLGVLDDQQTQDIVAREERLEAATGKGIAVMLFPDQPGSAPEDLAYAVAQTLNVDGQIAAVVWVDRAADTSRFAVMQTPGFTTIPQSTVDSISTSFQADMQTGKFGDAIVAAVDRTATALEGTSTPMPTLPPEPLETAAPQAGPAGLAPGQVIIRPGRGASSTGTVIAIFVAFAIVVVFVTLALRREHQD
jgi:uncharacterized membrane protein YgcG